MSIHYSSTIKLLSNSLITEYDIRQGNVSVMEAFHLTDDSTIQRIKKMPKEERVRTVGLMMREDKEFGRQLEDKFDVVVNDFLKANDLDIKVDVTDIRRDAVYVIAKHIEHTSFYNGKVVFRPKETYHAMIRIGPKLTFFFRTRDSDKPHVEIDGFLNDKLDDNLKIIERLRPGMISFLEEFIEIHEGAGGDKRKVYEWVRDFCTMYKSRELDKEYYREFNRDAGFKIWLGDQPTVFRSILDEDIDNIDISFNYQNIVVPLLQILV